MDWLARPMLVADHARMRSAHDTHLTHSPSMVDVRAFVCRESSFFLASLSSAKHVVGASRTNCNQGGVLRQNTTTCRHPRKHYCLCGATLLVYCNISTPRYSTHLPVQCPLKNAHKRLYYIIVVILWPCQMPSSINQVSPDRA